MLNKNIFIITTFIIFIIYYYYYYFYKSTNLPRHRTTDSLYAHFSSVDTFNYLIFPKLIFTHPTYYTLTAGTSIYIPKNWWHWVKTIKKTFAINYWFNNTQLPTIKDLDKTINPFIFKTNTNYDINILNDEKVTMWDSKTEEIEDTIFAKFYNSSIDYKYIITLDNYTAGRNNNNILTKMKPFIKFPENENITTNNFGYNIWVSSGKHDTGLHYDDEDGILSVVEGEKTVIMFPPSDTSYLYPYKVNYEWLTNNAINFRYNSYLFLYKINGVSSSQLLYETCKNDVRVLSNISKLYKNNSNNNLIWGFKKNKDIYRWEIYKYTLDKIPTITSNDIMQDEYNVGNEEHYYYNVQTAMQTAMQTALLPNPGLPFWGYGKYKKDNIMYDESKIFVIDSYISFFNNYDNYMDKLEYTKIKEIFKNIILNKYQCYEICIHNKNISQIFVQYLGITNTDFLNFLIQNKYPQNIIDFIQKKVFMQEYNINNEITIVYDINTMEIIRSGFYGII